MQQKHTKRSVLESTALGRFLLEEVPWRVENIHDHTDLPEAEVTELAWQLWDICLNYDAVDKCIAAYLSRK